MFKSSDLQIETMAAETQVTLMAVGDIMLGDRPICIGHGVGTKIKKRGVNYPFSQVVPTLKRGDIVHGNLEVVLSNSGMDSKRLSSVQMRAMPKAVEGLTYAGFNVLSLANNHILEHGEKALLETMSILSQHNIKYIGVASNVTKAREPLIMDIKGITIAFLAYCLVPDKTAYITIEDPKEICSDVKKAKSSADIVIVSLHWGNEYIEKPSLSQIRLAHQTVDSGAMVILGHHPHVLQDIEKYHRGVIAYSLGNFVFDMWQEKMRKSMILRICFSKEGITDMEVLPVHINNSYQPEILQGKRAKGLSSETERQSSNIAIEDSHDLANSMQEYDVEVASHRRQYRRELKWYFLKHLYRYPPRFTLQLVKEYLNRELNAATRNENIDKS